MAKYTVTIKTLIDNNFHFALDDYPIFNENYRTVLNQKILNHYYIHEIGFETAELFNFFLSTKMNEIMPLYNTLYGEQQKMLESDLFKNVNLEESMESDNTTSSTSENTSESTSNSNSNGKNTQLYQDTPQGKIYENGLETGNWATNYTRNDNENEINDTSNSTSNQKNDMSSNYNYIKKIVGNNGNMYNIEILERIKNNLMNIDMLIIEELNELFMKIW